MLHQIQKNSEILEANPNRLPHYKTRHKAIAPLIAMALIFFKFCSQLICAVTWAKPPHSCSVYNHLYSVYSIVFMTWLQLSFNFLNKYNPKNLVQGFSVI
jgi:hypothetical protein